MQTAVKKRLQILSGSYNPQLSEKVAKQLKIKVGLTKLQKFANGEIKCQLGESVRGADLFIFQTHSPPVNDAIMEQAIIIDAAKRASARHITAICPLLGYARQDRKATGREPISAKLVVDILKMAGADRVVSIDLHSGQIQGFFDGPFDHLTALPVLSAHIKKKFDNDLVIVSPDAGRVKVADRYARKLGADLAIVHKRRVRAGLSEARQVIGDVRARHCVIVDDMIDTASTIGPAADLLKQRGANSVSAATTHGIFSPPAQERLQNSAIDYLVVTDTMPPSLNLTKPKLEIVSVAPLLAAAVEAIFEDSSVSALFEGKNQF